jgi:hypothetical protein
MRYSLRVAGGGEPGDDPSPVVPDQGKASSAQVIGYRQHVFDENLDAVIFGAVRTVGSSVPTAVWSSREMPALEGLQQSRPHLAMFRKAVKEQDQIPCPFPAEIQAHAVYFDRLVHASLLLTVRTIAASLPPEEDR